MKLEELVIELSKDPFNPELNFNAAVEYERINQTASAVSFYLRTAEYGSNLLAYNSLLKLARCFEDQNDRINTVSNCILQAAALLPNRPEAYFMMSQFYERNGNWQECYTWACLGLATEETTEGLRSSVGYQNKLMLEFEQAVAAWWIGRRDESLKILNKLNDAGMPEEYKIAIRSNLERIHVDV